MKTKKNIFLLLAILLTITGYSQIDYFGETRPGISPLSFEPLIIDSLMTEKGDYQERIMFSKDGKSCYIHSINYKNKTSLTTISLDKEMSIWSSPDTSFFSKYHDGNYIAISPGSDTVLFSQTVGIDWGNIFLSVKEVGGWSVPVKLPSPINSDSVENYICYANSGNIYFSSGRNGKAVYKTNLNDPQPTVEEVMRWDTYYEYFVSPDESYIIFGSGETFDIHYAQEWDMYVTFKKK